MGLVGSVAACNLSSMGSTAPTVVRFSEEAATAGLAHEYDGEFDYYVGGGVAAFDCDDNLMPDVYIAGGTQRASMFVNRTSARGSLAFERATSETTDLDSVTGAYPIDIDSDGVTDLVVLRNGENVLLRGLGGCQFERANEAWNFDGGDDWNTAFSARWDDGASFPTLAIGRYLGTTDPNEYFCADNELVLPSPDGSGFAEVKPLTPGWCTLSMLFSDWNRTGERDLRISNDRHYYGADSDGQEQLWRVDASGDASEYTAAEGWQTLRIWGMGIASYDVTGDGLPEYYLTSQGDNKMQALMNGFAVPTYEDIALELNATAHRPYEGDTTKPSTAWHDDFQDFNNDGLIDLFVTKGNVEAMPEYAAQDPNNLLLGTADGKFVESASAAGLVDFARSRGAAVADLNADGLLDIVVVARLENVRVWRNTGPGQNWLELSLRQEGTNRDAIGAWIEVTSGDRVQLRELTVGGGHVSGTLGPVHFGLGDAQNAQVKVIWPDGEAGSEISVEANALYEIARDGGAALKLR
jgi:hypothetical protein